MRRLTPAPSQPPAKATAIPTKATAIPSHWRRRSRSDLIRQCSPMAVNTGEV
ncbi:hypothetical protein [Anaeromyxobacter diazotrophicus]|uniref:hypothetical protein n=1 Tax=Anaeromyxobacter diazotrophicus TaxID=2590199 RepID=UPI001F3019E3|nr:hypothetical protein [Anaeromyxobacter diazotrophicus]